MKIVEIPGPKHQVISQPDSERLRTVYFKPLGLGCVACLFNSAARLSRISIDPSRAYMYTCPLQVPSIVPSLLLKAFAAGRMLMTIFEEFKKIIGFAVCSLWPPCEHRSTTDLKMVLAVIQYPRE